jgi:hypothetical protein
MSMTNSVVLIVPAALQDQANRLACAVGYDAAPLPGDTFSRPLSSDGSTLTTHYGCHTWADAAFLGLLQNAAQGQLPPVAWTDYGLSANDVAGVMSALIVSVRDMAAVPVEHWNDVLATNGLVAVAPPEKPPPQ